MPAPHIEELTTDEQWDAAVPILRELWNEKPPAEIRAWRDESGYRLFGCYAGAETDELVAVAGVSIQRVLHHVRHAWIHDFVVGEAHRREGYGSELLERLESWAEERNCEYVALALRDGNDAAGDFYRKHGVERWGDVLEKRL